MSANRIRLNPGRTLSFRWPIPDGELFMGPETILLVDDEDMIIDVGKGMLEKLGYRVIVAQGGKQAIEAHTT